MTETLTTAPLPDVAKGRLRRAILRAPAVLIPGGILLLIVLAAILAPLIAPHDPNHTDLSAVLAPPGSGHPLGGDGSGRDVLSRLVWGARISLLAGLVATVTSILIGVPAGLVAGYRRGVVDSALTWVADLIMSVPGIVALLLVVAAIGTAMPPTMIAFGILLAPGFFRMTRSTVIAVRRELFVDAARVSGLSPARILFRHILSVVATPILIQAAFVAGIAIAVQAGMEYLGLGNPLVPSWGAMVNDAIRNNASAPHLLLWPGLAIGITVACLALLGSGFSDVLNQSTGRARKTRSARLASEPKPLSTVARDAAPATRERDTSSLRVEGLKVAYPTADGDLREVVKGVSFSVDRGECLGIVGESGSGKSQTAFAVLGLLPTEAVRSAEELMLAEHDLLAATERQLDALRSTRIAYVPQDPMSSLDPVHTIGSQMVETIRAHSRMSRAQAREHALDLLKQMGIADPGRTFAAYPHQISGGMAQRVLIALAISCDPDVLIADEPTTALDVTVQAEILDLLRMLQRTQNLALVIVTHNFGVVADICDRVAVMRHGTIVETADVFQLFSQPAHEYTRSLLASTLANVTPRSRLAGGARPEGASHVAQ